MMKITVWKLEPTGSNADCERMDGVSSVTVPVTTCMNILASKALLLCHGTEKCRQLNSEESRVNGLRMN